MTAIIIFMTILAVTVYLLTANMFSNPEREQSSLKDHWRAIRNKQNQYTEMRRRAG